jgi:hypothetical protein
MRVWRIFARAAIVRNAAVRFAAGEARRRGARVSGLALSRPGRAGVLI